MSSEGAKFGSIPRTTVTIASDEEYDDIINNMIAMTEAQLSELSLYQSSWSKQIKNAMLVNGGNLEHASHMDYLMHFLTFGLKIIFASCPPPGKGHGWPCFWVSLFYIGVMVLIIRYNRTIGMIDLKTCNAAANFIKIISSSDVKSHIIKRLNSFTESVIHYNK